MKMTFLEALFAVCALKCHNRFDLYLIVKKFAETAHIFGLTIILAKTEVLLQRVPASTTSAPSISIEDTKLKMVDDFTYLASTIALE